MLRPLGRAIDGFLSRGAGLDENGDPFGPPLTPEEREACLDRIRSARFAQTSPPYLSPLPLPDTSPDVHVVLMPPVTGRSWAVLVPPYGAFAKPTRLGLYGIHARALQRRGYGVAVLHLPYHGARAMPDRPSGWGFVRADLGHTSRALAAGAAETMALARHLREESGAERVIGIGMSLGGAAVGLAASMGAPFDGLGFIAAVDNPASFYGTGQNREARRKTLLAQGYDIPRVAEAFAPFAPSTYAPPLPPERLRFAIPPQDLVVPPSWQEAWRVAWSGSDVKLHWHGHGTALASALVAERVVDALAGPV